MFNTSRPFKKGDSTKMRAWQRMLSGRRLDLINPSAMDIEIEDIAHGLSRVARWNGQTTGSHAFSVAQHSVVVERISHTLEPGTAHTWLLAALLHDASEYVVGDMISPFKNALGINYRAFEDKLMQAVHVRFGLPAVISPQMKKFIKRSDKISAYLEATQLAGFSEAEGRKLFGPPPITVKDWTVQPLEPNDAKKLFLDRFYTLSEQAEAAAA
jgi:5'-deoxynucleotidase YfbR-like HD superfamily hydrolase